MSRYVLRRLLAVPLMLLGVTVLTFVVVHLTPGSPVDALRLSDPSIRPEDLASIQQTLGLDRPLHEQYLGWLGQLVHGDMGRSMRTYRPVQALIADRLPNTLLLTATALLVAVALSVPLGVLAAVRRNGLADQVITLLAALGQALPTFWVGLLLILLFAVQAAALGLPALPSGGAQGVLAGGDLRDRAAHLALPVATLALAQTAGWTRYVRGQLLEVLAQDYVRTARAKGLREQVVLMRHALRNALSPLVTLVGLAVPNLFGGAVIVEALFSWPGLGNLAVDAAAGHDYTVMMGLTVFVAAVTVLANLATDVAYVIVDPRVGYG